VEKNVKRFSEAGKISLDAVTTKVGRGEGEEDLIVG